MSITTVSNAPSNPFRAISNYLHGVMDRLEAGRDAKNAARMAEKAMKPANLSMRALETAQRATTYAWNVAEAMNLWVLDLQKLRRDLTEARVKIDNQGGEIQHHHEQIRSHNVSFEVLLTQIDLLHDALQAERRSRDDMARAISSGLRDTADKIDGLIRDPRQDVMCLFRDPIPSGWGLTDEQLHKAIVG